MSVQEFLFYLDSFSFYYFCDLKGRHSNLVRRGSMVLKDLPPAGHPSRHLPRETHTLSSGSPGSGSSRGRVLPLPPLASLWIWRWLTSPTLPMPASGAALGHVNGCGHEGACGGRKQSSTPQGPFPPHRSRQFPQNATAKEVNWFVWEGWKDLRHSNSL